MKRISKADLLDVIRLGGDGCPIADLDDYVLIEHEEIGPIPELDIGSKCGVVIGI
jgi:hypothetical protein